MTPPTTVHSPLRLYGRSGEIAALDALLTRLHHGDGGALVLTAPPGSGRTALLAHAAATHQDRGAGPVLHVVAAPGERWVPYSGLHALLGTPGPVPPDVLLARLRRTGGGRPLLVCVDDAHLWDPGSRAALALAARRTGPGTPVAVLIAAGDGAGFAGLPALRPGPLDDEAAAALLDRLTGADRADPVVRGELLREAAGNPGLLTGLTARLTPAQLAGRTPL
ncbi:AAA family ATPase, partial [Streptomyces sp. IBSBF 3010]|uniref:AAA family ATPase n=1 Tax=Streptomyces sp. IBSBF 3010 TaxID=2903526 RepID=UPI002FDC1F8C